MLYDFYLFYVYVPQSEADRLKIALGEAGAGKFDGYDCCFWGCQGTGQFRPLQGSQPAIGTVNQLESVSEIRLESMVRREQCDEVRKALFAHHPYEVPAYGFLPMEAFEQKGRPQTYAGEAGFRAEYTGLSLVFGPLALGEMAGTRPETETFSEILRLSQIFRFDYSGKLVRLYWEISPQHATPRLEERQVQVDEWFASQQCRTWWEPARLQISSDKPARLWGEITMPR